MNRQTVPLKVIRRLAQRRDIILELSRSVLELHQQFASSYNRAKEWEIVWQNIVRYLDIRIPGTALAKSSPEWGGSHVHDMKDYVNPKVTQKTHNVVRSMQISFYNTLINWCFNILIQRSSSPLSGTASSTSLTVFSSTMAKEEVRSSYTDLQIAFFGPQGAAIWRWLITCDVIETKKVVSDISILYDRLVSSGASDPCGLMFSDYMALASTLSTHHDDRLLLLIHKVKCVKTYLLSTPQVALSILLTWATRNECIVASHYLWKMSCLNLQGVLANIPVLSLHEMWQYMFRPNLRGYFLPWLVWVMINNLGLKWFIDTQSEPFSIPEWLNINNPSHRMFLIRAVTLLRALYLYLAYNIKVEPSRSADSLLKEYLSLTNETRFACFLPLDVDVGINKESLSWEPSDPTQTSTSVTGVPIRQIWAHIFDESSMSADRYVMTLVQNKYSIQQIPPLYRDRYKLLLRKEYASPYDRHVAEHMGEWNDMSETPYDPIDVYHGYFPVPNPPVRNGGLLPPVSSTAGMSSLSFPYSGVTATTTTTCATTPVVVTGVLSGNGDGTNSTVTATAATVCTATTTTTDNISSSRSFSGNYGTTSLTTTPCVAIIDGVPCRNDGVLIMDGPENDNDDDQNGYINDEPSLAYEDALENGLDNDAMSYLLDVPSAPGVVRSSGRSKGGGGGGGKSKGHTHSFSLPKNHTHEHPNNPSKFRGKVLYEQPKFRHEMKKGFSGKLNKPGKGNGHYPDPHNIKDPAKRLAAIKQITAISYAVTEKDLSRKKK